MMKLAGLLLLALAPSASAFALAVRPAICLARGPALGPPSAHVAAPVPLARSARAPARTSSARMGLFGLGWPEIGVIAVLALLFFGPERLAPMAKDLGKSASNLKEITESFSEGMAEADAEKVKIVDGNAEETVEVLPPKMED